MYLTCKYIFGCGGTQHPLCTFCDAGDATVFKNVAGKETMSPVLIRVLSYD